ncbi:perlucin-like protein [Mercenaria mercenaria]|uniref:perlucin-like protein n=1 Tax=Mercenaria mercenaria TaxID=6596 RepID=UPI00234F251A|nr:perlucin-like protein [Mercenaria mercenaria]
MVVSSVIIIGLVFLCGKSVEGQCTDGFIKHGDSCYHFSRDTETWLDALVSCEKIYGGHLAEIEDAKENNFLINEVETLGARYWIGGNDLRVEGEWKWYTSNTDITYSTWLPGNPSGGVEDCLEIVDSDGKGPLKPAWNDLQCHSFQKYICETPINEGQIIG